MANLQTLASHVTKAVDACKTDTSHVARQEMLDAIEALRVAAMGPPEYITRLRYQALQNTCIVMALELGLVQALVVKDRKEITADELAGSTGSDRLLTVRLMRMLTALHLATESGLETYVSNANTVCLATPSNIGAMRFMTNTSMRNMASVVPYMRSNGGAFHQFPDKAEGQKSAAEFAYGMPLWELFRTEPDTLADFVAYLSGRREGMVAMWWEIFDLKGLLGGKLSEEEGELLVVDVGGNVGYDLLALKKRYPECKGRLLLQDLKENILKAKVLTEGTGIECMEYDFFTPQPVKGARVYFFGGICHDWPDKETRKLLGNTVEAMDEGSLLLIGEFPLPDVKAPLNLVTYDVLMMLNVCGIERTIGAWKELLGGVGLELVKVWTSPLDSVLETRLKR